MSPKPEVSTSGYAFCCRLTETRRGGLGRKKDEKILKDNFQESLRDLSEISRGGGGVETEGGSQLFKTAEKGGVMKNGPLTGEDHANMCP